MTTPEQLVRSVQDVVNTGDLDRIPQLVHPDFVSHHAGIAGQDAFAGYIAMFRDAFPDLTGEVEGVITEGDRVAWRVRGTGTHEGEFMGIAPTGRQITYTGMDQGRLAPDGRVAEHWGGLDLFGLMSQLQ
jgi:predicted ester cyclase